MNRAAFVTCLGLIACQSRTPAFESEEAGPMDAAFDARSIDATVDAAPDQGLPVPEVECQTNRDCEGQLVNRCVGTPNGVPNVDDSASNRCVFDPSGRGFRLTQAQISLPEGAALLGSVLNGFIADADLNLTVFFENVSSWGETDDGFEPEHRAWILNANDNEGVLASPRPGHPTTSARTQVAVCPPGYVDCVDIFSTASDGSGSALPLWLPHDDIEEECDVLPFILVGGVSLQISEEGEGYLRVSGLLPPTLARAFQLRLPGQELKSMSQILEEAGIPPDVDANDDGVPESWSFAFEGPAVQVSVTGGLAGAQEQTPCD